MDRNRERGTYVLANSATSFASQAYWCRPFPAASATSWSRLVRMSVLTVVGLTRNFSAICFVVSGRERFSFAPHVQASAYLSLGSLGQVRACEV